MDVVQLQKAYLATKRRLFLLDYDGTLIDLKPTPPEAKPDSHLLQTLKELANDQANTIVIISGRDHRTLQEWLGELPINMVAEHGLFSRKNQGEWVCKITIDSAWKTTARERMTNYTAQLPGSSIEDKATALAWHTRAAADGDKARQLEDELEHELLAIGKPLGLRVIHGNRVIEVQPGGFDKGTAAREWLKTRHWDFILAAGDDTTDEDLFKAMPEQAYTIKIRPAPSVAKYQLSGAADFRAVLQSLRR